MTAALHLAALAAFSALMLAAAVEDFRRLVIPNRLILALIATWPLYLATGGLALVAALAALGVAVAVLAVGALLFARGLIGGGDVKLLCAAALWAGPAATPQLLVLTALFGGVLSLILLSPLGARLSLAGRALLGPPDAADAAGGRIAVPYGMAIAGAALFVTLQPLFG
jgi:prepilin peptidase CpaA